MNRNDDKNSNTLISNEGEKKIPCDNMSISESNTEINLKSLLKGWKSRYKPISIDWGEPVGKEIW